MAIVLVSSATDATGASAAATLTTSFEVLAGTDLLLVGIAARSDSAEQPTGATWDGDALTLLDDANDNSGEAVMEVYYMTDPKVGTYNVVSTCSGNQNIVNLILAFSGVDTGDPFNTPVSATGGGATNSISVTYDGATDQYAIAFLCKKYADSAPSSDSGQTNLINDVTGRAGDNEDCYGYADKEDTPAASNTTGWSWTTNRFCAAVGVSIKASADVARKIIQTIIMG